jgi:hypothetical protein
MPRLFPLDVDTMSLHALDSGQNFRVVVLQIPPNTAQNWTVTNRGNGRYAISTDAVDGTERFLTGQSNGGSHLYALPQDPDFENQTWRRDQGPVSGLISMGLSGRFLKGDCGDSVAIEPDNGGPRGFDVELVRIENFGACSAWGPPDAFA